MDKFTKQIEEIICKRIPPPAQPSEFVEEIVEQQRETARAIVEDVLALVSAELEPIRARMET
jgi:hypothetical protein